MTDLVYKFTNDVLFKWLFIRNQDLLKRLVAEMLGIRIDSITEFIITNPDIPPEVLGEKFCRLDINMVVDDRRIGLEMQVANEGDHPERSLYYWAREFSSALAPGGEYIDLPRTIVISILGFKLFPCAEYYSEHMALEVTRHTVLSDRFCLKFYELPKLPEIENADDELKLWLTLFNAKTEEDLQKIETMEVSIMNQAIGAYRTATADAKFREIERLRSRARNNEASALGHARREGIAIGAETEREKWQVVVADKDAALADKDAALADAETEREKWKGVVADKDAALADKDAALAGKDAEIERLRAQLEKRNGESN